MKLIIEDDEGRKTVVPFLREELTIGRQEGNTIRLTERNVSRRHCRLSRQNGHVFIEDLGSYNGVRVNGDRIGERQPVKPGDLIEVGDYDLAIEVETAAQAAPDPASIATAQHVMPDDLKQTIRVPAYDESKPPAPLSLQPTRSAAGPQAPHKPEPTSVIKPATRDDGRRAEEVPPGEAPRLVALTTEHAGREFVLDRTVVIVGKAAENDVAVDHRSVSRQHCRIVRESDGSWKVFDLQSANGVKVNGEPYGESVLRAGDSLQLGHVRFRFVGPGENFAFTPEAATSVTQAIEVPQKSRTPLLIGAALAAVVVIGGGLAVAFATGAIGGSKSPDDAIAAKDPATAGEPRAGEPREPKPDEPTAAEPVKPDEPVAAKEPDKLPDGAVAAAAAKLEPAPAEPPAAAAKGGAEELAAAWQALSAQKWAEAVKLAEAADGKGAGDEARTLADKARTEQSAAQALDAAGKALKARKYAAAFDELDKIPEGTAAEPKARPLRLQAGIGFAEAKVNEAKNLAKDRKYEAAFASLDEAEARAPGTSAVAKTRAELEARRAAGAKGGGAAASAAKAGDKPGGAIPEDASARRDEAKKSFDTGVALASKGQYKQAIVAFNRSLELNPALAESHKYLGTCYAQTGDGESGAKHYRKFLDLQPNHPQAPQIRKILEQYEEFTKKGGG